MTSTPVTPSLLPAQSIHSSIEKLIKRMSSVFQTKDSTSNLPEPPQYLLDYFEGDRKKAAKCHQIIEAWRLENDIDDRIKYKPKHYDVVTSYLHSCMIGRAKNGKDIVLAESYEKYDLKRFQELGIEPKDFQAVIILFHEYLHNIVNEDPNMEKENGIYTVLDASTLDVKGILNPKVKKLNDAALQTLDTYYLTRSKKIFVVNHPRIFNMFWPAIKLTLPANLQKKVVLVRNNKEIENYIDFDILPQNLGGNYPKIATESDMHLQFLNFVNSLPSEEEFMANPKNNYEVQENGKL
jgi:hypothetical protein